MLFSNIRKSSSYVRMNHKFLVMNVGDTLIGVMESAPGKIGLQLPSKLELSHSTKHQYRR